MKARVARFVGRTWARVGYAYHVEPTWHTFGAITTVLIVEYFYLVEGEKVKPSEPEPTW